MGAILNCNFKEISPQLRDKILKDKKISIIVTTFRGVDWYKQVKNFPCFTVYENPKDFPGKFVVRVFDGNIPLRLMTVSNTLEQARETIPHSFYRFPRQETDDPIIVETWM